MKAETDSNPVQMGGVEIEQSKCEKYLGDLISDKGCVDSITKTIKKIIESNYRKCEEILKIADNGLLVGMGNSKTAITLFEAQVVPAVLFNCESWIGLNKAHINTKGVKANRVSAHRNDIKCR